VRKPNPRVWLLEDHDLRCVPTGLQDFWHAA
jgi:hypothetical protein